MISISVAKVIAKLLVDLALGTTGGTNQAWPVFYSNEPDMPDNCITVYDTGENEDGRLLRTGEHQVFPTIQVRVRSSVYDDGYEKCQAIRQTVERIGVRGGTGLEWVTVNVEGDNYIVQNMKLISGITPFPQQEKNKRRVFVCDIQVTIEE